MLAILIRILKGHLNYTIFKTTQKNNQELLKSIKLFYRIGANCFFLLFIFKLSDVDVSL